MAGRLRSLDAFRGATIAGMILVNNPGSWAHVYPPLLHAAWHGWTPTDLIFPFFLFILGAAIPFSLGRRLAAGAGRWRLFLKALGRSGVLVALGLLLAAWPFFDLGTLRLPGVLQRIGVVYLVTAAAYLRLGRRGLLALTVVCLAGFHAVMRWWPVPGGVAGDLEPGRTSPPSSTGRSSAPTSIREPGIPKARSPRFRRSEARSSGCSPGSGCAPGGRRSRRRPASSPPVSPC